MRFGVVLALLASAAGCENLVGITDKTLTLTSDAGGVADPSAPCSQQPLPFAFCDDFDSVSKVSDTWDWNTISPAQSGSMALETTEFTSPPRSARVVAQPIMGSVQLGILRNLGGATKFRIAFDLRLELDALTGVSQVGLVQANAGNGITLNYVVGPGAACALKVYDQSGAPPALLDSVPGTTLPPLRAWTRIVLAYDSAAGATVYQDGRRIAQSGGAVRSGSLGMTGFILGAVYVNPSGSAGLTSEFDNVVIR